MEVEDEEDAGDNDPTSDATGDSSTADNPIPPNNVANNENYKISRYISPY